MDMTSERAKRTNSVRIELVTTYEQLLHAYAVRSICFMEEHSVRARQNYDGNDYQSTHIIVYEDDEPVGTARVRWFRDFAKIERTCFRKEHRRPEIIKATAQFIFDHAARKGYDKVITHAKPAYARLWRILLGFKPAQGKEPVLFEGHDEPYLELVKTIVPAVDAIDADTSSAVLFRIEGQWDQPSEFETRARV
ncbi:GNAT family N-acetyltransferase [Aurantimonas sp. Leaf443]|uniref:GNAT family N-acetyltransferase n=1 Tax=Aurantimonas sp. Leaf443 TaxID=1736378 RepID=UPI000AC4EC40|nr:GNAT family N-acetyltransferase [Aurantimonas sp. Leaf443]